MIAPPLRGSPAPPPPLFSLKRMAPPLRGSQATPPPTLSSENVICLRSAPGAATRWSCAVSPKRVTISSSRRTGLHACRSAAREWVYRPTAAASFAGTGGAPWMTRLSGGVRSAACIAEARRRSNAQRGIISPQYTEAFVVKIERHEHLGTGDASRQFLRHERRQLARRSVRAVGVGVPVARAAPAAHACPRVPRPGRARRTSRDRRRAGADVRPGDGGVSSRRRASRQSVLAVRRTDFPPRDERRLAGAPRPRRREARPRRGITSRSSLADRLADLRGVPRARRRVGADDRGPGAGVRGRRGP